MPVRPKTLLVSLTLVLLGVTSCSRTKTDAAGQPGRAEELREIATILPLYSGQHKRGPRQASDLAPYEAGAPLGYRAVVANEIVIVWGATMPGEGEGGGTEAVVAYQKKAPTEGGWVLLQNGKVLEMTADQFQAAPKAGQ
jgi:hypothetical protein